MPNYEFECECGYKTIELRTMSKRNEPKECSKCNKLMNRLIGGGAGFIFSGEGFYETDYKRKEDNGQ